MVSSIYRQFSCTNWPVLLSVKKVLTKSCYVLHRPLNMLVSRAATGIVVWNEGSSFDPGTPLVEARVELDMRAQKKDKYIEAFSRPVPIMHR